MLSGRSLTGKPVGIVEDFLTAEERAALLSHARSPEARWETYMPPADGWYDRLMNPQLMPPAIREMIGAIRRRTAKTIAAHYELSAPVYADTMQMVRWNPGNLQMPHADSEHNNGRPNMYPWRAFASIIYLNDDFEGGQIYFPDRDMEPAIRPGMLAYFPSTTDYLHGVREVTSGIRYTLASFYTFDKSRHDGEPI